MRKSVIIIICMMLPITFVCHGQAAQVHPHLLVKHEDKEVVLGKIKSQVWAGSIYDEIFNNVTPYVKRHAANPEWILSRYLMNRVPGKRYTRAVSDRQGARLTGWSGDAPVPTVRVSPHMRSPVTPTGGSYRKPSIDELAPYDTSRFMNLLNLETNKMERIDPQAYVGDINGDINDLALEAAIVFWLEGDRQYAKFAADIINQWAKGAYYQEPITGPCRTGFLDVQTLGDGAHRSLILAYDFVYPYMKANGYDLRYYETVFEKFASTLAFRGFWDNNWYAAESSTMVLAALSLENIQKRDYYLQFFLERDTINGSCGQLALPSTVQKWLTPDGHWKEPGGYHNYPVGNLLLSSYVLEKNGYDIFRRFPALFRASYAMLKYSFPDLTVSAFGDTGRASQSAESLEIGIFAAIKYNQPELPEMLASMKKLMEGRGYRRETSGYLGLLCFIPDIPDTRTLYSWPRSGVLEFAKFYLQRNGTDPDYGLMYGVQGASYNHNHCNGMAMEIYGAGEVLGIDAGTGPNYEHPYHVQYYSQWAAHNTVIAAGSSSSVPVSGTAGRKDIGHIDLAAMEPQPDKEAVSDLCSFTDTRYFDKSTGTSQARTLAIVRTSEKSGYYIDIYRSDNPESNDYIYHNIGDTVLFLNEKREPLAALPAQYPLSGKDNPGLRYFSGVHKLENWNGNLIARFDAINGKREKIFMQVLMPGASGRTYYQARSPKTKTSGREYSGRTLPLFTMRDENESFSNPFTALYEPYRESAGYSVESIIAEKMTNPAKTTALLVNNRNGDQQLVIQSVDPAVEISKPEWSFKGYFGVAGLKEGRPCYLYLGSGSEIRYKGYSLKSGISGASANLVISTDKYIVSCNQATEVFVPLKGVRSATLKDGARTLKLKVLISGAGISVVVPAVKKGELTFSTDGYPGETGGWAELMTAEDVCKAYPERMKSLIGSLDLDNRGLKKVRDAYEENNIVKACEQLLEYYRKGTTASYLRKELPASSPDNDSDADSIVLNIYNFYNQPYRVPKDVNGHLYWQCHGPSDDIEWAWALNRHYHISTLLSSYFRTGNSKYAKTIDRDIKDWITCSLPYPGVKSNSEMWRGLEVSFRVKAWSNVFYGLMKSSDLTPATRLLILSSLPEHAHYARNFHAQGNWLTMELSGLATVATSWPEFKESSSWLRYSSESMTKSLGEQVYPDGAQTELTSSYHTVALNNFTLFKEICDRAGYTLPVNFSSQLENMWNYLAFTIKPDGYGLLNNDADLINNRQRIIKASEHYNRPDWLFIATNGEKGAKPSGYPSVIFPWAGHFIMRSGFEKEAHFGFFDIGPWGTGHQHNDKLHLSLSAFGRDFLVDGGRFAYRGEVASTFRNYAVGSLSHNVMIPDGKLQGAGPSLAKEPVNPANYSINGIYDFASGSFDRFTGFDGKINHNRSVLYVRGEFWIVLDHISGGNRKKSEFLWHWHPDCEVRIEEDGISAVNGDSEMRLIQAQPGKMKIELIRGQLNPYPQGWYSAEYNIAVPSVASVFTGEIDENSNFLWLIVPAKRSSGKATLKILEENEEGMKAAISYEGKVWEVFIPVYNSTLTRIHLISDMSRK